MKQFKVVGEIVLLLTAVLAPVLFGIGLAKIGGTSTDVSSLAVFGKDATFICEWSNQDGSEALFVSENGTRRFISLEHQRVRATTGQRYRLHQRLIPKWGTRIILQHV